MEKMSALSGSEGNDRRSQYARNVEMSLMSDQFHNDAHLLPALSADLDVRIITEALFQSSKLWKRGKA
ncbi:MAG: hypothetical protein P4M11_04605 [Candidatus Pacebacteria bacterium]|nr:hypothetical protein [Candidatus Paceibacterota bacterium]